MIIYLYAYICICENYNKSLQILVFPSISIILSDMLCNIPKIYQKISPLPFQLYYNFFVCLPLYLWKFPQKSSNFHTNFHNLIRNVKQKSSVLSENVSTFFFHLFIVVFVCLSLYLRIIKKSTILSIFLCYYLFYHT